MLKIIAFTLAPLSGSISTKFFLVMVNVLIARSLFYTNARVICRKGNTTFCVGKKNWIIPSTISRARASTMIKILSLLKSFFLWRRNFRNRLGNDKQRLYATIKKVKSFMVNRLRRLAQLAGLFYIYG